MTTVETIEVIKTLSDESFVALGGYKELSKYMSFETIARAVFFPGQTLYMSILASSPDTLLSYDLQLYGYLPQTYLTVLSESFTPLYSSILNPTSIQGKTVYLFGTTQQERLLLYSKHFNRFLFHFPTYQLSNTIQVISLTRAPQSVFDSVLSSYRNLKRSSSFKSVVDNIYVNFSYPLLYLFSCPPSQPLTTLLSPSNQSSFDSPQLYLSSSSPITFCITSISNSPFNTLIGLTELELISTLSPSYQKIFFDSLSQSHYWLSNDLSHRLKVSFSGPTVFSSIKESFSFKTLSVSDSIGDISRLISKNNIYTLKPFKDTHPRLDITAFA
jgi:hypothetical protein